MGGKLLKRINYLIDCILEIIFPNPPHCIICGYEEEGICKSCIKSIKLCEEEEYYGYYSGVLKELIHLFKFKKDFLAGEILVNMLESKIKHIDKDYILTYIPIGKKSKRKRGFNQCEYMAKKLSRKLDLRCNNTLIKIKETKVQKELSKSERIENIKNSFGITNSQLIKGNKFILIDDVVTTGATLKEGVKVLKENGALEIKILTIAKSRI